VQGKQPEACTLAKQARDHALTLTLTLT